ncbi:lipopolysaccharide/colanic/teichoic acid biosynthesis glycosyltransferase [Thermosipho japonicus]|uniref:Lipopolysaccharide/colanic/teichoic acid biosynthesis glycosyltransferase n=2 Tax=Thermosipho japonicus TaxID=90323 RepID=A0A841GSP5_9BACT|nr:sugar transferase [Thermosipho japonicus]MBB6062819.1 lipopolysaccharide/colanic/teichoic acid biosynthesis glycosyltransferase [Thermosipho japonicus]
MSRLLFAIDFISFFIVSFLATNSLVFSMFSSLFLVLSLFAFRTYENVEVKNDHFLRIIVSYFFGIAIILILNLPFDFHISKFFYIYSFLLAITLLPIVHFAIYKFALVKTPVKRYLVIGKKEEFYDILSEIEEKSKGKIEFVDFINPTPALLKEKVKAADRVLVCDLELEEYVKDDLEILSNTYKVEYLPNLVEKVLKRIPIKVIEKFEEYYKISFRNVSESPAKRVLDIFGSIVGLIVFSPFMLITAIAILIEDGRPVVFRQKRVGKNENLFEFIKLRSLKNTKIDKNSPNKDIEKRVLKIGKIIRKTRIDETLQFWLVLKGEMSLVGPRPEMVEYHGMMKGNIPFYTYRLLLKPGLTGWAQLNYKHSSTLEEYKIKTEYDLYYVKNRNIFLDLQIILQTLEAIIWKRGAR